MLLWFESIEQILYDKLKPLLKYMYITTHTNDKRDESLKMQPRNVW